MKYSSLCLALSLCALWCSFCKAEKEECFIKENLLFSLSYDMAAKKRKKDLMNNNTKVPCESPAEGCTVGFCRARKCHRVISAKRKKAHAPGFGFHQKSLAEVNTRTLCNTDL